MKSSVLIRIAAACAVVVAFLLGARVASAAGTLTIANKDPQEVDGKWKLNMTINYGTPPHLPHIPMLFVFTQTVHLERALTDKSPEKPIIVRTPLQNQQPINESMDVGFSDGTGKIFATTKFDFVIRRDRGFEAGEYQLKVKREGDGVEVGQPQTIRLQGDNPIIDRRAIVFSGEKKKKPEGAEKSEGGGDAAPSGEKKKEEPSSAETPPASPSGSEGGGDAPSDPAPVPPKQGGCGCRLVDGASSPTGIAAALGLGLAIALRRRRRRAPL